MTNLNSPRLHTDAGISAVDFTVKRHPRTTREAFPADYAESALGIDGPPVAPVTGWRAIWRDLVEFMSSPTFQGEKQ